MGRALFPQGPLIIHSPGESVGIRAHIYQTKAKQQKKSKSFALRLQIMWH